ncbi:MAG: hypothetical protein QOE97_1523 [Pseudonocardiales bacterium]|nr:hypothetical protein [Pseudonocardiales bacterium]
MNRTVVHDTFVLERSYPASPARVFGAFADIATKKQWWGPDEFDKDAEHELDFRVGGRETLSGTLPGSGSETFTYDGVYQDIVAGERIVYTYEMTMKGRRISVSVATLEFLPDGDQTRFVITEQGAYLDGLDTSAQREEGTNELLNALGTYLEKAI